MTITGGTMRVTRLLPDGSPDPTHKPLVLDGASFTLTERTTAPMTTDPGTAGVPLAFVDCETTGLDPDLHEIWEVGAIIRRDGEPDTEYLWQLPVDLGVADSFALNIGRFHERRPDADISTDLAYWAGAFAELTWGCHLVGAVPSFDDERLRKLLRRHGACPGWHYHLCDIEALAIGYMRGSLDADDERLALAAPPWKSRELSKALGVDPDSYDAHTALGDARWARDLYDRVMA